MFGRKTRLPDQFWPDSMNPQVDIERTIWFHDDFGRTASFNPFAHSAWLGTSVWRLGGLVSVKSGTDWFAWLFSCFFNFCLSSHDSVMLRLPGSFCLINLTLRGLRFREKGSMGGFRGLGGMSGPRTHTLGCVWASGMFDHNSINKWLIYPDMLRYIGWYFLQFVWISTWSLLDNFLGTAIPWTTAPIQWQNLMLKV